MTRMHHADDLTFHVKSLAALYPDKLARAWERLVVGDQYLHNREILLLW